MFKRPVYVLFVFDCFCVEVYTFDRIDNLSRVWNYFDLSNDSLTMCLQSDFPYLTVVLYLLCWPSLTDLRTFSPPLETKYLSWCVKSFAEECSDFKVSVNPSITFLR